MSYPFIDLVSETVLGLVAAAVGLLLQDIDERRESRRGRISPIQRQLRSRTPLRDLGLTLGAAGVVLAMPGLVAVVWGASIIGFEPGPAPPFDVAPRDLLPHVMFAVLVAFVLSVLACLIRMLKSRSVHTRRDASQRKP